MASTEQTIKLVRRIFAGERIPLPEGIRTLWDIFLALHETRGGDIGPAPITFTEIDAYARLLRWPLEPRHVSLIRAIDRAWMEQANKQVGVAPPKSGASAGRAQAVNPAAFDAVFG